MHLNRQRRLALTGKQVRVGEKQREAEKRGQLASEGETERSSALGTDDF